MDDLDITLSAAYLPGKYNGIADRLSSKKPLLEWHLLREARERIFSKWGIPEVDLFASARSAIISRYVTLDARDKNAIFIDAFSRIWRLNNAWIFPPPSLIPRILAHLNKCQGQFILIAPKWEQTFWMTDLISRCNEPPITIENLDRCLVDLSTGLAPSQVEALTLQAWIIGCGQI